MYVALDLPGKRWNLIMVVRDILSGANDPSARQSIYRFLSKDADLQWNAGVREQDERLRVMTAMDNASWKVAELPASATTHFEKLEALSYKLVLLKGQAIESALSPGQTPAAFLETDALAFINTQIEFDRELGRALDSPEVQAYPSLIKTYDGFYAVWESLDRREAFLRGGRWTQAISLLTRVARLVLMAESWDWNEFNPQTGQAAGDFALQRAGQTIDLLNRYKEDGLKRG